MRILTSIIFMLASVVIYAQGNEQKHTPTSANQGYKFMNNGEVITITDNATGKVYTYSATDTLHYAMMRKLMPERPVIKDKPTPTERKREEVVR